MEGRANRHNLFRYLLREGEGAKILVDDSCTGQSQLHFLHKRNAGKWSRLELSSRH